ncbi:MAG: DNA gyrase subunit A [Candidatus Firestonebacteria bacterium]|nr:DNA gyrase subunit A [Candidatus Firestonebacteria bacterium]
MYTQGEKLKSVYIEDEMKNSYIDYAMSVIVGRALPDVRDGLKPVHRRVLYAMHEMGLVHGKPYRKSAAVVGEVMGKYHPHGDVAIYDTLVRLVQDFSMRYPLADGQGNFGSVDGDSPAAMRYTEVRMEKITAALLKEIEKETVNFIPNYDESLKEPVVLPSGFPNLLVNGSCGIAVGMSTNIPPHNLCEVIDGLIYLIENPDAQIDDFLTIIKGPDFPTGGYIYGKDGIIRAYRTGRGIITVRGRVCTEKLKNGRENIIINEIPYQVNKTKLIEDIAKLVNDKKVEGISDLRDESDREGMRIVIELKKDQIPQLIINQLYKHTQLQDSFGIIMLALVNNQPKVLNIKEILYYYLEHRKEIVVRRSRFDLRKAEEKAHILEGLKIALQNLDAVIKTIRSSASPEEAKIELCKKFKLSVIQAQAILDMRLQRLTGLEREKIDKEYLETIKIIEYLRSILANPKLVLQIINKELNEIKQEYKDERRTHIIEDVKEFKIEDLIADEDMVITISHDGYIKRLPVAAYRKQRRGGKGSTGMETKEEDFVEHLFIASTHNYILFSTDFGKCYWLKVYDIPQAGRAAKGKAIVNMIEISQGEKIRAFIPVKDFKEDLYLVMCTQNGIIKKTSLDAYSNPRTTGVIAINIDEGDKLISASLTTGKEDLILATHNGIAIRFPESDVRPIGRVARGVKGIELEKGDYVIGMEVAKEEDTLLSVSEKGFGKRTIINEYRLQSRGGHGVINIKITDRTGCVVGIKKVTNEDEIMVITTQGKIIRMSVNGIRPTGRNTQGVKVIDLDDNDMVGAIAKVTPDDEEVEEGNNLEETSDNE